MNIFDFVYDVNRQRFYSYCIYQTIKIVIIIVHFSFCAAPQSLSHFNKYKKSNTRKRYSAIRFVAAADWNTNSLNIHLS